MLVSFVDPEPRPPRNVRVEFNYVEFNQLVWILEGVAKGGMVPITARSLGGHFVSFLHAYKQGEFVCSQG